MPTYHARDITVRMGSVPLAETITSNIVVKKGELAKQQSEHAEKKLLHSPYLQEKRVMFSDATDFFELNWLGNAPFMQVEADSGTTLPSGLTGSALPDRAPQALALHVELSDRSFQSGFTGRTHLKIEVLFNGQLSACSLTHTNDIRSGAKSFHQVFAGYRVDFLAERPWVLLPSLIRADGGMRSFRKTTTPSERFDEISAALLEEVEKRGTDKHGAPPPSAEFIDALAKMQAPASVVNLQKPGGKRFGVVDVIITAGTGNKLTTGMSYLKRPQRLKDSKYAVRTEIESELESNTNAAASGPDKTRGTAGEFAERLKPGLNNAYVDMDRSMDMLDERPCKRRALSLARAESQHAARNTNFQTSRLNVRGPFLPASDGTTLQRHVSPTTGGVTSCSSPPAHRNDSHKEPVLSNDRNSTCQTVRELPQMQGHSTIASRSFQQCQSLPASLCPRVPQTIPVLSTSVGMPSSDSLTGHWALDVSTFPGPAVSISSIAHGRSEGSPSFPQPIWSGENDPSTTDAPYVAPTAWTLPADTSWPSSPITMNSPYFRPLYAPQQGQSNTRPPSPVSGIPPNDLPNLAPHFPFFYGRPGYTPLATNMLPSPVLQIGRRLPPTAMFSVPSKPRRRTSPSKGVILTEPAGRSCGVLVSRLVIMGLNGRPVVDHRWKIGRCILVGERGPAMGGAQISASAPDSEHEEPKDKFHAQQRSRPHIESAQANSRTSPPIKVVNSDIDRQSMREQQRESLQDGQADLFAKLPLPYPKRHQGPFNETPMVSPQIDVPDNIAPYVSGPTLMTAPQTHIAHAMQTASPALPNALISSPRRAVPRNTLPSIQGPKATTFLYDDPEEVLREAARIRRSRSPIKPPVDARASSITLPAHPNAIADKNGPGGSSPLSSVPSSPSPPNHIPRLDGVSESTLPTASPRGQSPQKSIVSTPKLPHPSPAQPQPSRSPDSKKRKLANRWPVKAPRSPNRLKTANNPPLNDDCVIAFAESIDKNEKTGVLRQVKGERQGVFEEDYVVFAVRFYIAGG
ncbi:hypothetical protein SVAN01_06380 [Stagonosporopsis vannaccii]|nr:hypothetical protein SVAN01_06380 [Stagonosporopsis vannaccii]